MEVYSVFFFLLELDGPNSVTCVCFFVNIVVEMLVTTASVR